MARRKVIIVGGGFGGLNAAKKLARQPDLEVILMDRRNHHLFQPLLYQVAMAGLSPAEISMPIRSVLRHRDNVRVLMAEVLDIRRGEKKIRTTIGEFEYDYLILACGAEHSYFGHPEWEEFAPGLKTVEQATEIRNRVLMAFERAEVQPINDPQLQAWLTFVVIGGGPTGVELSGALAEITRHTLAEDFRHIDPRHARVILVEAGPRLLPSFPDSLVARAMRDLKTLGVEVSLDTRVTAVSAEGVHVGERLIAAHTVIWAAGVKPSGLNAKLQSPVDRLGRVIVTPGLTLIKDPAVFIIGDQAHTPDAHGNPLPGLAPVAMQQGRFVARQIRRDLQGRARETFTYKDKGQMATIGRRRAIAMSGGLRFTGLLAWLMWLLIHIYYLIGFRNRLAVMWNWTYSYLTYKRGARLITKRDWHLSGD